MFYRRKIILALLQIFEGNLPKVSLQKLLFLFTEKQVNRNYDFVPYKYGCYSFSANADLMAMVRHGQLLDNKTSYTKVDTEDYIKSLNENDKQILIDVKSSYGNLTADSLTKLTYLNYQYYAINSVKAKEILTWEQLQNVLKAKPINDQTVLFTIGYEGISLEEYLNRLIKNDVRILIDVRNNPVSMKFGFSKKQLKTFCENLNIEYMHIPEVGIQSDQRQKLNTQKDYDSLFEIYKKQNLQKTGSQQEQILNLLKEKKRVALTCFEANICQCHRKHLAEAITRFPEWNYELKHI
ncbi:DUF488 domain-containing protein [Dyadobacter sediminis]|uniref:DUF488 domain-containing protein n=1 Tax=Dyadobacter sediminis TaxID=1493691 RepID=A0A5R9K6T8_9BACT|nr:DUF488 domain-containing protein [Dyadobacter sediminis]TLU89494.1 DUF488 domain-containing protein [Dyadobacter sediminis]GGC04928.1 hypothetical protein GCM10011325_34760 [Dyadobacter sediminis]